MATLLSMFRAELIYQLATAASSITAANNRKQDLCASQSDTLGTVVAFLCDSAAGY